MDRTHDPTRQPFLKAPAKVPTGQRNEIVYYYKDGICVTDTWLVVGDRRYQVTELDQPRTVRGARHPSARNAAIMSGVVAAIVLITARYLNTAGWIGAAIVLAVPLVVLAGGLLRQPRPYELWADYRGMTVRLLADADTQRYHQICRALTRARERAGTVPGLPD